MVFGVGALMVHMELYCIVNSYSSCPCLDSWVIVTTERIEILSGVKPPKEPSLVSVTIILMLVQLKNKCYIAMRLL